MLTDPSQMRHSYNVEGFHIEQADDDPVIQFDRWFKEAVGSEVMEPNAMALATADKDGRPSVRMVLLKEFSHRGFVFYTNYESRKAEEIAGNPVVSLMFWWDRIFRQVRIEGTVTRNDPADSDGYFASRPYGSRIGASVSPQSRTLQSRAELENAWKEMEQRYPDEVPRPDFWGGYVVRPSSFEFWQGQQSRLHDRIVYTIDGDGWQKRRIAP
jgi:pyridoxamine 5'-phosphate oxidase